MKKILTLLFSFIIVLAFSVTVLAEPVSQELTSSENVSSNESTTSNESVTSSENIISSESAPSSEVQTSSETTTSSESATSSETLTSSENTTSSESSTSSKVPTSSQSNTSSKVPTSSESITSSKVPTSSESTTSSENSTSSKVPTSSQSNTSSKVPTSSQSNTTSKVPTSSESTTSSENSLSKPTEKKESKLQIVELPKKTVYEVGEKLDLTGLKVNIISDSGVVTSNNGKNLTITKNTFKTEGEQKIEVKYKNLTAHFYVTVGPKHTHKYGAWSIKTEATCEQNGQKVRECDCGEKETMEVNKLDHNWVAGEVVKKSTTESEGEIEYNCTRCEKKKSEIIPKLSEEKVETQTKPKFKPKFNFKFNFNFKFTLKWWMILLPVALIIAGYVSAIKAIFKKKV